MVDALAARKAIPVFADELNIEVVALHQSSACLDFLTAMKEEAIKVVIKIK